MSLWAELPKKSVVIYLCESGYICLSSDAQLSFESIEFSRNLRGSLQN